MTSWASLSFPTATICTKTKMDSLYLRDLYLKEQIVDASLGHIHDGIGSAVLVSAADAARGAIVLWYEEKAISASSNAIFYLTADRSSGGMTVFPSTSPPFPLILRGDGNNFDLRKIGHIVAGTRNYNFKLSYSSGRWQIQVWNKDSSSAYTFRAMAAGPPADGV